jgi:hypothetical protein
MAPSNMTSGVCLVSFHSEICYPFGKLWCNSDFGDTSTPGETKGLYCWEADI